MSFHQSKENATKESEQFDKDSVKEMYINSIRQDKIYPFYTIKKASNSLDKESVKEICLATVQYNSDAIRHIYLSESITDVDMLKEICLAAVQKNGYAIDEIRQYFPHVIDEDMCLIAVKSRPHAIKTVTKCKALGKNSMKKICSEAVRKNPVTIKLVPDRFITRDFLAQLYLYD